MIVYVLTAHWEYEGSSVLGVFSSEEAAMSWLTDGKSFGRDYVLLTREAVDDPMMTSSEDPKEVWRR